MSYGIQIKTVKTMNDIEAIFEKNGIVDYEFNFVGFEDEKKVIDFYFLSAKDKEKAIKILKQK